MGTSTELKFFTEGEVPQTPGDLVAREAWAGRLAAALMLLGCSAAVLALAYHFTFRDPVVGWPAAISFGSFFELLLFGIGALVLFVVFVVSLLAGLAFLSTVLAALKPSNWVLRATSEALYVKFRAYTDHRLPQDDPVVLVIPRPAVRWLRPHDQRARHVGRRGDVASSEDDALVRQQYLEIALDTDLAEMAERLAEELKQWSPTFVPGIKQRSTGAPVSVRPNDVLRIDWKTKGTRMRPALSAAVRHLDTAYRLAETVESEQQQAKTLAPDDREARLLEMVRQGNTIDAVIVAKDLYGFSTTEAKQFLDELQKG